MNRKRRREHDCVHLKLAAAIAKLERECKRRSLLGPLPVVPSLRRSLSRTANSLSHNTPRNVAKKALIGGRRVGNSVCWIGARSSEDPKAGRRESERADPRTSVIYSLCFAKRG